ncbi:MAG: precorrin-6y C5,15-methyltransferase (decarboxylating) subunit CbiE [Alphaproteobacteria bacterium]|nr:precorrin-6y C5,15-methyltransferase (decarboxylating) subunit CbiE [Alphaproteobacteria bacterium]
MSIDPLAHQDAAPRRWLSIVGVGEDGIEGLSATARALIADADVVFGGKRHLALVGGLVQGEARPWPSPFDRALEQVLAQRGRQVCVLATGDPFWHGVGALLASRISMAEIIALPAPSSFSLATARLGWSIPETKLISLHARALDMLRPHLQPGTQVLALTSDGSGPAGVARMLAETGFGSSRLTVLEALGGPRERISTYEALAFDRTEVDPLNLVAIEVVAEPGARVIPRTPGLPDALFEHDGQITKREIRAITLSSLSPRRGEMLWDVGAGAGSIAIEWTLADPSMQAVAIEARADRVSRIHRNAAALGVPGIAVREGAAPAALPRRVTPDAVFVGGGAADPGVLDACISALRSGGRLVVNAVTLETEALLIGRHASMGGELTRLSVERAKPLGTMVAWQPALPVTQWLWVKP